METQAASASPRSYQQQLKEEAIARRTRMGIAARPSPPTVVIKPLPPPSMLTKSGPCAHDRHDTDYMREYMRKRRAASVKPAPPTLSPQELIEDLLEGRVNARKIITIVARAHGFTTDEICLHRRRVELADAKTHLVDVIVRETSLSHVAIGELLDLNHGLITYHRKRFPEREKFFADKITTVDAAINLLCKRSAPMGQGQTSQLALELA